MQKHTEVENFLQLSGKFRLNFSHLLRVPKLMRCNHFHPFINVQHSQKRVPPAVGAQIPPLCLLNKRHRALTHPAQPRQHRLFSPQLALIQRHRGLPADHPRLHKPQRQVHTFWEGNRDGCFLCQPVDIGDDAAFHHHQMRDQLRCRPFIHSGAISPLFRGNRIGRPKKSSLSPPKLFANRLE